MGAELTIKVHNPFPTEDTAFATSSGGALPDATTFSFLVVAWFNGSDESDNDYAGWIKTIPSEWENITTASPNLQIDMAWTAPVDATGETRYPSHYTIYYQEDTSFTLGSAAVKISTVDGNTVTFTFDTYPGTGTPTFAATDTSFVINPILDITQQLRQMTVRAADGRLVKKSYAHINPVEHLDIKIVASSITNVNYKKLLLYSLFSIQCRIAESVTAVPEDDPFVQFWFGRWIDLSDYIGSSKKNMKTVFNLRFQVEAATLV